MADQYKDSLPSIEKLILNNTSADSLVELPHSVGFGINLIRLYLQYYSFVITSKFFNTVKSYIHVC